MGVQEKVVSRYQDSHSKERRYKPFETRERILDAARSLFASRGYLNTSTQEIAAEAGVAEGSIFYHFGAKKNLLSALGFVFAQEMVVAMRGDSDDLSDLEPGTTISRAFEFVSGHGFTEQTLGLAFDSPDLQPFILAHRDVVVGFIAQCYEATLKPEQRNGLDIEIAASLSYAVVCDAFSILHDCQDLEKHKHILSQTICFVRQALGYKTPFAESAPAQKLKKEG